MVLVVLVLVFTAIGSLNTWELIGNDQYSLIEDWGISRLKRQDKWEEKFKDKFPETKLEKSCSEMHQTDKTPFIAVVLFRTSGRLICMGSIVDKRHILTAKRCYEKTDATDLKVLVGYYKAYWGKYSQVLNVMKIVRHEYEVALLRLHNRIEFTDYVKPVRLLPSITKKEADFKKNFPPPYKVVGFFVDRYDVPGDFIEKKETYQIKEDDFVDFAECQKNYTKLILDKSKLFCTLGNATYCWGGWGGPVLKWMSDTYYLQVGVVIADNCTISTTGPFLVARTDVYGDWIRGNSFQGHQPK